MDRIGLMQRLGLRLRHRVKLKQMQRLRRRLQKRRQGKSEQDQQRGETSSIGSTGCFNCARLPDPMRCRLSASTVHNSISPCFIPYNTGHEGPETGSCFSLLHQRSYALGCSMEIPWDRRTIAFQYGTCHPWILLLIARCNLITVTLLEPISGHEITLPGSPISWSEYEEAPGFVLSLSHSCYTVLIIFNSFQSKLLFFRKGDRDWTLLRLPWFIDSFNTFRGDLYALRLSDDTVSEEARYLLAVYTTQPTPSIKKFCMDTTQLPLPEFSQSFQHHLVESPDGEELLLVLQIITWCGQGCDQFTFPTLGFHVFKADLSRKTWIRKETLGDDRVLIITQLQTLFLPAASVGHGVKGNCIYFSTLSSTGQTPLKMFDLDSETVTDCPFSIPSNAGQFMFAPSIHMLDPQQLV